MIVPSAVSSRLNSPWWAAQSPAIVKKLVV
jgi:hypothetical protein